MQSNAFFQTTRGRILESIKRRGRRTAFELAAEHGLTPNAVRQHLGRLSADGLVEESTARRGPTKPSLIYSVTREGERLFPQRYDALLNAVLDELRAEGGQERVTDLFRRIGRRSAQKYGKRFAGKDAAGRVLELTRILQERGIVADCEQAGDGFVIREHSCPFKDTVAEHPQVCEVVHSLMGEVLPARPTQRTSIARGDACCEFHVPAPKERDTPYGLP